MIQAFIDGIKEISTHTLTWSVTSSSMWSRQTLDISTHTLTWSVTRVKKLVNYQILISTHTLTWSVTIGIADHASVSVNFNSHAHVERDYSGFATGTNYQDFNSHAHVERDKFI